MQVFPRPRTKDADPLAGRMITYLVGLGVLLVAVVGALVDRGYGIGSPWAVAVLAGAAALAERGKVQLERGDQTTSSISNLPVLFTALVFGPLPAMLVGAVSMLGGISRPYLK